MTPTTTPPAVLINDARVFDSRSGVLADRGYVLIEQNLISTIGRAPADRAMLDALAPGTQVIDAGGRVLIPGLIDAHWHSIFATTPLAALLQASADYLQLVAGRAAEETLLRGITTVRDAGGPVFGLKAAIDGGVLPGPRIFPSGAMISQTGGHGDFRTRADLPRGRLGPLSHPELLGAIAIADGADAVLAACREQLMLGASQLKLMAGGGVASSYDPLDVTQYTEAELRAAVEAAENWGSYVMVHAYTPRAVQQAMRAGVRCIEHGQLLDEATIAQMAENGTWWCLQPFLDDDDAVPLTGPSREKQLQMVAGTDEAYALGRKHGVKIAWGTDTLFDPGLATRQIGQLVKLAHWYDPTEILQQATAVNAELLGLSGPRNPYPQGNLGVVEPGALADLIVVDGNPLDNIGLIADPASGFLLIMKDGRLVKNLL